MIIFAERWGIWVFFIAIAWLFVLFGVLIAGGFPIADPHASDRPFHQFVCLWLVLTAASVYVLARYRAGRRSDASSGPMLQPPPEVDSFLFIRMSYWPYIIMALALWAFVASTFD